MQFAPPAVLSVTTTHRPLVQVMLTTMKTAASVFPSAVPGIFCPSVCIATPAKRFVVQAFFLQVLTTYFGNFYRCVDTSHPFLF